MSSVPGLKFLQRMKKVFTRCKERQLNDHESKHLCEKLDCSLDLIWRSHSAFQKNATFKEYADRFPKMCSCWREHGRSHCVTEFIWRCLYAPFFVPSFELHIIEVPMQRTPGAVRVALFSFLMLIAAQPFCASDAEAREAAKPNPEILAMSPTHSVQQPNHDQLTMSEQNIGGKKFHVGVQAVNAPKDHVWKILTDYEGASTHFSYLKKSHKVKGSQDGLVGFTAKTGVGPLTVDYVLHITESQPNGMIEWKRHSGAFKSNEGYWKLEPIGDGKRTLVTYAKHVDAGFPFPPHLAHKAVKESMPVIFRDLGASLERTRTAGKAITN